MKKRLYLIIVFILLCGCKESIGSFHDGSLNYAMLYQQVMDKRYEEHWKYAMLQDSNWDSKKIEEVYHLDMTKVEEVIVRSSVMELEMSELAFFKVNKENEHYVKDAITKRMHDISVLWTPYKEDTQELLETSKQGRIGQYYYFILGEDSKKVVNYIRNQD